MNLDVDCERRIYGSLIIIMISFSSWKIMEENMIFVCLYSMYDFCEQRVGDIHS